MTVSYEVERAGGTIKDNNKESELLRAELYIAGYITHNLPYVVSVLWHIGQYMLVYPRNILYNRKRLPIKFDLNYLAPLCG